MNSIKESQFVAMNDLFNDDELYFYESHPLRSPSCFSSPKFDAAQNWQWVSLEPKSMDHFCCFCANVHDWNQ
jgi:hypothetical protein